MIYKQNYTFTCHSASALWALTIMENMFIAALYNQIVNSSQEKQTRLKTAMYCHKCRQSIGIYDFYKTNFETAMVVLPSC